MTLFYLCRKASLITAALLWLTTYSHASEESAAQQLMDQLPGVLDILLERQKVNQEIQHRTEDPISFAANPRQDVLPTQRDPFSFTQEMIQARQGEGVSSPTSFRSGSVASRLPTLKLKGVISRDSEQSPLALLEIGGEGVYMVSQGDEISFDPGNPNHVIKVQSIERLSVMVEVGTVGDIMVVR